MATRQNYDDFLKTLRAEQLGADGRFLGPQSGTAFYAQGQTPEQFYKSHLNDQKDTGRFTGYGDDMRPEMEDIGPVSADWVEGSTHKRGLLNGVTEMMSNPKTLMGLAAMGGIGALGGAFSGGASGFSGIGGTGGSAGIGSGTALGGAELAAAGAGDIAALGGSQIAALSPAATGSGFSFAMPEIMTAGTGVDLGAIGTTAIPGEAAAAGLLGNQSAAETARLASMNAGTNTLGGISPNSALNSSSMLDTAGQFLKDNPTLLKLGGAAIGAMTGKDSTTSNSSSRDPWKEAQPYLIDNLKTNAAMQEHYRANPFSDLQKQQYQGLFNSLGNAQANVPGLLANANAFGQSKRGAMPAMQGLLSGTQAAPIDWSQYANIGRRG